MGQADLRAAVLIEGGELCPTIADIGDDAAIAARTLEFRWVNPLLSSPFPGGGPD